MNPAKNQNPKPFTTEAQRHRENQKSKNMREAIVFKDFLCVSVVHGFNVFL
jgi:hypothetical protein